MKTYLAWGVWTGTTMFPDFFRVRSNAQIYAARRGMSGETFRRLSKPYIGVQEFSGTWSNVRASRVVPRLWKEYCRTHNGAKLVQVRVSTAK